MVRTIEGRRAVKLVVGADEENALTTFVVDELRTRGHLVEVIDPDRWPVVARRVAEAVSCGAAEQGMLFCWTGTGTAMVANKVGGVRAALAWDPWIAEGARRWNDANVLVMSFKLTTNDQAREILDAWFSVAAPDPEEADNIAELNALDRKIGSAATL